MVSGLGIEIWLRLWLKRLGSGLSKFRFRLTIRDYRDRKTYYRILSASTIYMSL